MKLIRLYIIAMTVLFVVIIAIGLASCGGSSSTDSGSSSSGDTVALSGTLGSGSAASLFSKAAASGYTVVAVDNASNATYHTTTDASGGFSLDVPADGSYSLSIINDGSYIGPTVFGGSGAEVNTVITPSADEDLGSINVDEDNGYATAATAPASVDSSITAVAVDGVPVGAGNDGKTEQSGITNRTDSDFDMDGVPNIFDADEDNDGIRNGVASTASGAEVVSSYVESVFLSSNIWADHDTAEEAKDLIALWINVLPVEGQEDQIASVQCVGVPSSIASVATIRWSGSIGVPEADYPDENSLWSDSSYNLYHATELSFDKWIVSITPRAAMNVGDVFTVRVTFTDATYEDFFLPISYFLTDWSRVSTYNGTSMPAAEGIKTDPVEFNADSLEIVFTKPTDEDGNILEGLSYSIIYGESDCTGGTCSVPSSTTEVSVTDTGADTLTTSVPTTASATYYVTPVAETSDGQRNGEETWFTRQ